MTFLHKHWLPLAGFLLYCLWFVLQLEEWKKHGSDYMLLTANFVVTTLLWVILCIAIGKYWKDANRTAKIKAAIKDEVEPKFLALVSPEKSGRVGKPAYSGSCPPVPKTYLET